MHDSLGRSTIIYAIVMITIIYEHKNVVTSNLGSSVRSVPLIGERVVHMLEESHS